MAGVAHFSNGHEHIGVGRFRILGGQGLEYWGPRFRILGAKGGGGKFPAGT